MKILIIEDDAKNLESLKKQIDEHLGLGHELTIVRNAKGLREHILEIVDHKFDLVLTDMFIPVGRDDNYGPDMDSSALVPAGLIAVVTSINANVPCYLCTDSNGHHSLLGMLLESGADGEDLCGSYDGIISNKELRIFTCVTRPNMIDGKNWQLGYRMVKGSKWESYLVSKGVAVKPAR